MWRLTLLLCGVMFFVLLIGGEDRGQLRPGLAAAEAERAANAARPAREVEPAPVLVTAGERAPEPAPPVAAAVPEAPPPTAPEPAVAEIAVEEIAVEETAPEPALPVTPAPEPAPQSAIHFSVGLGIDTPEPAPIADPAALPAPEPSEPPAQAPTTPGGQILYVSADAVNVREGASTAAPVLGRLTRGEPAAVLWEEGPDWLRIEALNSGLEGFVARRFLSDQP